MAGDEEEDDYLSMTFGEAPAPVKETTLQRTARLKKEAAERGRIPSKKELAEKEKVAREKALATQLDESNKGAKMMAKMGFKGGALGKSENARTEPIELLMKHDRGGIGADAEKKRKIREAADEMEGQEKRRKVDEVEYRERTRLEREERRAEGQWWSAMRTLESFDTGAYATETKQFESPTKDEAESESTAGGVDQRAEAPTMRSANLLWRPLVKQRLEKECERRMKYDLQQSLSRSNQYDDPDADEDDKLAYGKEIEELDEPDPELEEYMALPAAERLDKIIKEMREKYHYCFWCKFRYEDDTMDGCPGLTEDEHG